MSRSVSAVLIAIVIAIAAGRPAVAWGVPRTIDEPPRVIAWVVTSDDRALVERVRGQLSDLDVALDILHGKAPLDDAGAREGVDPATVLAVVWFVRSAPTEDRIAVHVFEVASKRESVRMLGDGAPAEDGALSSATLEAAALVVREAVRALAAREAPPAAPPPEPPPPSPPRKAAARVSFRADLSWSAVFDGADGGVRNGPGVGLGVQARGFELGLFAATTLPTEDEDAYGVIRLRRHAFGARAGYEWRTSGGLALTLGVRAGLALYARSTESPKPEVTPSSGRSNPSLLVGPELRLGWAPASGPFELTLLAGLDLVPSAPEIGYDVDGRFMPTLTIERVQPFVGVGAAFRSGALH